MQIGSVTEREVTRALVTLRRRGLAEKSVRRYRASLSSFFGWAVRERIVQHNPVTPTRVPKASEVQKEMHPFSEAELETFVQDAAQLAPRDSIGPVAAANRARDLDRLADILLVAGWTGLRWSELREVRVSDITMAPVPGIYVRRATPEGGEVKTTKSGKSRFVPLADRVLPVVRKLIEGRTPRDLVFVTATGHRLHATATKRAVDWELISHGRRIHDLRHTAACLWLAKGVSATTVQAWMGHASIATTNIYLHHLGTVADQAGLDRLNGSGGIRGESENRDQP
ncbi:tyrosine-type recombinase/integrase [Nocardioides sp. NBC_00850]|uniref:tyrosine-type recombinase/integrase n=1 Tax=Nocardioides sp. NBC_00850 TaxID=2976001 RepID=UPI0038664A26|nr:tyrosine-type recombinase/integrase [Nocardioides sp. NBC_00850]